MRLSLLVVAGAAAAYLRDPQRRDQVLRRGRALLGSRGGGGRSSGAAQGARDYDDVTLARRVESAIFRPAELHALKGHVSVNVADHVVELRGEVPDANLIEAFGSTAQGVDGVRGVHNLLHTPGQEPGHSPPSTPDEVRERAEHDHVDSGFASSPATRPAPE